MNLSQHKAGVGFFVIAGIALIITGIMALGGNRLFHDDIEYVLYFDTSVSGLSIGAPVVFRGVPLGSVTRISLVSNANKSNVTIPVHIRINEKNLVLATGVAVKSETEEHTVIRDMVGKGMRARLQLGSFITGQYRVDLDFFPEKEAIFRSSTPLQEIPTIASPIDALQRSLSRVPVEKVMANMENVLMRISRLIESGKVEQSLDSMNGAFTAMGDLMASLKALTPKLDALLEQAERGATAFRSDLPATLGSTRQAMANVSLAAKRLEATASQAGKNYGENSKLQAELTRLLEETTRTVRQLRSLADSLERNPESLLRGRKGAY